MSTKRKGTIAERELFHLFWKHGWCCLRTAGSGSTTMPAPDLLASNTKGVYAIECKALKTKRKHFPSKEIHELEQFATKFGAIPVIAIRFNRHPWYFIEIEKLKKTVTGNYSINIKSAQELGKTFEEIIHDLPRG